MSGDGSLVKLFFELPAGSPIGAESLWGAKTSEGRYRLDNSPLYVYGFSLGDVVSAVEKEGILKVQRLCIRGGHSTYRVFLAAGLDIGSPEFEALWAKLNLPAK